MISVASLKLMSNILICKMQDVSVHDDLYVLQGTVTVSVDATDIFDPYEALDALDYRYG